MKMIKSNLGTLMGSFLALTALSLAPVAQSQNYAAPQAQRGLAVASMETRSAFATSMERQLRQRGVDARVQLEGDRRDLLRIEWQGLRRSDIYSFVSSLAVETAKQLGFSGIVFTNGTQRWDYDLARESMVWNPAQL